MSKSTAIQQFLQSIQEATQRIISYVLSAGARIFGPSDDNYPKTGVQPFEGDPDDEKRF